MKKIALVIIAVLTLAGPIALLAPSASASAADYCGARSQDQVKTSVDIGCVGKGNPVVDMAFAFIRFLSAGVGLVVIGSIIYGGLQYIGSRGDPGSTAAAIERIRGSVIALLIYIFAFAILNYIIPKGFLLR